MKNLWKGVFNFNTGLERAYSYAYSESQAKILMVKRIAKKQGMLPVEVMKWMKEHPERFSIKLEMEFEDD